MVARPSVLQTRMACAIWPCSSSAVVSRRVAVTACYVFMQATGLVNDHVVDCFRYEELGGTAVRSGR
jgi:Methyladenine glycosylase